MTPQSIAKARNVIGEGPRWNAAEQRLYWVDFIENQNIHTWDPGTQELHTYATEAPVTALGFRRSGGAHRRHSGASSDIQPCHPKAQRIHPGRRGTLAASATTEPWTRAAVSGSEACILRSSKSRMEPCTGSIPTDSVHTMDTGFTVSNGLGWSPDQRTFYFIDTFRRVILAYDYLADAGTITNRRVFARTVEADGYPDGMAVKAEGRCPGSVSWGGWKIIDMIRTAR